VPLGRMQLEQRCRGDYLGWDYTIADPEVQRVFELAMRCFVPRNFAPGALANRLMGTRFDVEMCRHFHPDRYCPEWLARAKGLSSALGHSSIDALRDHRLRAAAWSKSARGPARARARLTAANDRRAASPRGGAARAGATARRRCNLRPRQAPLAAREVPSPRGPCWPLKRNPKAPCTIPCCRYLCLAPAPRSEVPASRLSGPSLFPNLPTEPRAARRPLHHTSPTSARPVHTVAPPMHRVHIGDSTLGEGVELPGISLSLDERLEIARFLDEMGAPELEIGMR
jgi:hypothetical protein